VTHAEFDFARNGIGGHQSPRMLKDEWLTPHGDGRRALANSGGPSVLIAYGESDAGALRNSGIDGKWIDLR
jgi:hypothetical protein